MSLYQMVFGCDPRTPLILGMLGYERDAFCRFLDSHPHDGVFVVIARFTDPAYEPIKEKIAQHPLYDGIREIGDEIVFRFRKPDRTYTLPPEFIAHFNSDEEQAWQAVDYLNRC